MAVLGSLAQDTSTDLDLEKLFGENLRCEAEHTGGIIKTSLGECSVEVVARLRTCYTDKVICQKMVDQVNSLGHQYARSKCGLCKEKVSICWKVIPI